MSGGGGGGRWRWNWDRWQGWDVVFTLLGLALLVVTSVVSLTTLRVAKETAASQERAHRSEQYANATASLTDDTTFGRVAGAYGLFTYAESYEDHRTEVLQVLAARLKDSARTDADRLSGNELYVTASLLKRLTLLEPGEGDLRQYDIADAQLGGAALGGLKAEAAYFRRADFTGAFLEGVEWTCVDASGARLGGATLTGTITGVDLRGADLQTANRLDGLMLEAVSHDGSTQWPPDYPVPPNTPYDPDDCRAERLGE